MNYLISQIKICNKKTEDFFGLPVDVSYKRVTFSELSVIPPDGYADANEGYQAQSS